MEGTDKKCGVRVNDTFYEGDKRARLMNVESGWESVEKRRDGIGNGAL